MNANTKRLIVNGLKVGAKIGKQIFIEGGKAVLAGALVVGMEKIYRGGVAELKSTTVGEFLELEEGDEEEVE